MNDFAPSPSDSASGAAADLAAVFLLDAAGRVTAVSDAARALWQVEAGGLLGEGFPDLFVCEGTLGVAENGAVWLPASRLGGSRRAALFLATSVVVVLDRRLVVPDLHAAYATLDVAAEPFGAFVAGPSKTADIEQSLVVGAHGPKSLTVVLVS